MYCLNPRCPKPANPQSHRFCQTCGARLLLGDRYRAYQPLGNGESSRTFLGLDTHKITDNRCIIKRFQNQTGEERFRQETARLDELSSHPQIPDLYAYFEREDAQFLVQEFVEGRNLSQEMTQNGSFDESQIRALLAEILPLLQFLHDHQIIHRDIKPTNLIRKGQPSSGGQQAELDVTSWALTDAPELTGWLQPSKIQNPKSKIQNPKSLVLVDFGAAKRLTQSALARPGTLMGSAEYAAPEQLMGQATYASDLYSLGVTCIQLLTGLSPFELFDGVRGLWHWRSVAGTVSDTLAQVLDKMLATSLGDRFSSAAAVMDVLGIRNQESGVGSPGTRVSLKPEPESHWRCVGTLEAGAGVNAIAPLPGRDLLFSGGNNGRLVVWDCDRGEALWMFEEPGVVVTTVAVSPLGDTLASGGFDRTIKLWDWQAGTQTRTLAGHTDVVTAIAFAPDSTLYSASRDKTIRQWLPHTGEAIATFSSHKAAVEAIALHPQQPILVSGGAEGAVKIWHTGTRELLRTLSGHGAQVSAIALPPESATAQSSTVLSGSWDMSLKLRNLHAGGLRYNLTGHLLPITALSCNPSARLLSTASHDTTVKIWSLETGALQATLTGHTAAVESVAFLSEKRLASAGRDGTIRLWQVS
ncbi:serine/threonine-protein kinase [Thermoleptolyngbya sp. M55_K2018_002]|uniref:serine/threonine-protein kinase n=1 Tax=Thermoleptolyngbya sp. M55_K2018_002 TaxID=2747808 RepID=UPI0019D850C3|nr:serine/threonine-protein kinase [Thermoleptolyngbya sp. M55_K2018_002]HIK42638.1 serine/threonine protein kinase [Thermoleptolyngbya sp. M55_K2018_002]